ncbi:MAG: hypothetical protein EOP48_07920 [Sphingobacteriales bacterium]|nr:MAG: hypothetical protein EOP48_07920 [Sphingobacteriales bacterium]
MMKISNLFSMAVILAMLSLSSCRKSADSIPEVPVKNQSGCNGTDVAVNSWAVIDAEGKTTSVTVAAAELYNTKSSDDRIQYEFSGTTSSLGDYISFTFKGENPPKTGTYALVSTEQAITEGNDVFSIGVGGGTATTGGGLFSSSGTISVTNNDGAVSIEGKGLNYKTALGKALCVSFKLLYNKKPSTNPDPAGTLSTYTTKYFFPDHIATDDKGNVYTTGLLNGKQLQKFDTKGELVTAYTATDFGLAATEQPYIVGVCNDKAGTVWVLMVIANKPCRLYKITSASQPVLDRSIDNTKSSLKTIAVPDMEISSTGEVYYIVETDNSLVKKIDKDGVETSFISSNINNPFNLTNKNANLSDLSFDGADNLYISMNNSAFTYFGIYKYTGGVQTKLYGSTVRGPETVVNGTFSTGSFRTLQSLLASNDGKTLFVGDGNYVRKITLTDDKITTVAGNGQQSGITYMYNGPALTGRTLPMKMTLSPDQKNIVINSYGVLEKLTL